MDAPRIFVSSTIRDFSDLRGAVAHWASERGFSVQMSEFTSFERRPDADVFAACFENVARADVFVLLIGERRGSWYDEPARISVTQQEFRVAREANRQTSKPKIIAFLRHETQQALHHWEELGQPNRAVSWCDDPDFTSRFVNDVKGVEASHAEYWIAPFRTFGDVARGLDSHLSGGRSLRDVAGRLAVEEEVLFNLSLMVSRDQKGSLFPTHWFVRRDQTDVSVSTGELDKPLELTKRDIVSLGALSMALRAAPALRDVAISEHVRSGLFRVFDPVSGTLTSSAAHEALALLQSDMKALTGLADDRHVQSAKKNLALWLYEVNQTGREQALIGGIELLLGLAFYDQYENVYLRHVALARWLSGRGESPLPEAALRPPSPDLETAAKLEAERVSVAEVRAAVGSDQWPFGRVLSADDIDMLRQYSADPEIRDRGIESLTSMLGDRLSKNQIAALFESSLKASLDDLAANRQDTRP